MTYKEEIDAAVETNERLASELKDTTQELAAAITRSVELEEQVKVITAQLEEQVRLNQESAADVDRLSKLNEEFEAKLADFDTAVARAAQDQLAKTGCDPVSVTTDTEPASASTDDVHSLVKTLKSLQKDDPAKATAFWREHKAAFVRARNQ